MSGSKVGGVFSSRRDGLYGCVCAQVYGLTGTHKEVEQFDVMEQAEEKGLLV